MVIGEIEVLRWLHILAMVYWLGGEWGVFQTSYNVVNPKLALDERRRHVALLVAHYSRDLRRKERGAMIVVSVVRDSRGQHAHVETRGRR